MVRGGLSEEDTFELKSKGWEGPGSKDFSIVNVLKASEWRHSRVRSERMMLENEGGKDCDMGFGFFTQFNFIFRKAKN